jgi:hypothetical protein
MAEKLVFDVVAKASGAESVKKLGTALDDVGKSADDLDKKGSPGFFKQSADDAEQSSSRIGSAFKGLFTRTAKDADEGGKSVGSAFKGLFSRAEKDTEDGTKSIGSKFTSLFSDLAKNATEAGQKAGSALSKGLASATEDIGPLGPVLIGVVAAAAPFAGAVLAAGLIAGVASAGLAGGVILALQDPAIMAAAGELGQSIMAQLTVDAVPFKAPVMAAIAELQQAWNRSNADIRTLFANTAPLLAPLAASVGSAFNSITAGIASLSTAAAPVIGALGEGIRMIGDSIGSGFSSLADNGAAAATALTGAFVLIKVAIDTTFAAVNGLTAAFGWLAEHGVLGPGVSASYGVWKQTLDNAKASMDGLGTATTNATTAMQAQSNELKSETDPIFALITAQNTLRTAQDNVNTAIKQHGANSQEAKTAETALAQAAVDLGAKTTATAGVFNGQMPAGMRATLEAAGLTKTEIDAIAKSFETSASAGDAWARTYTAHVVTVYETLGDKAGSVAAPQATTTFKGYALGGIDYKMATGGAIASHFVKSPTVMYGERGPEAYVARDAPIARSRAIVEQVAEKWLGGQVTWGGGDSGSSSGGYGAKASTSASAGSGGVDLSPLLAELRQLRTAVERGGDVYLDGRKISATQGRDANLYARGR